MIAINIQFELLSGWLYMFHSWSVPPVGLSLIENLSIPPREVKEAFTASEPAG
jgi:hypothetical protein